MTKECFKEMIKSTEEIVVIAKGMKFVVKEENIIMKPLYAIFGDVSVSMDDKTINCQKLKIPYENVIAIISNAEGVI